MGVRPQDILIGNGKLTGPNTVKYDLPGRVDVGGTVTARDIIVASGSVPFVPPGAPPRPFPPPPSPPACARPKLAHTRLHVRLCPDAALAGRIEVVKLQSRGRYISRSHSRVSSWILQVGHAAAIALRIRFTFLWPVELRRHEVNASA